MLAVIKYTIGIIIGSILLTSCKKYLEEKPDKKLITPTTLRDLQLILDNEQIFNNTYPFAGDVACDDYYLTDADFGGLAILLRDVYSWEPTVDFSLDWQALYQKIFHANVVLDNINKVSNEEQLDFNAIKGSALFFRAIFLFRITQIHSLPYAANSAAILPGLPLILSSDINTVYARSSIKDTYSRIVTDLKEASTLLPKQSSPVTRPNRAAAFSLLSYTYLIIHDYENANRYADSSLSISAELIDYNSISPTSTNPFQRFNKEVLFQARNQSAPPMSPARCKVDSVLYNSYSNNDLRKALFYSNNNNGTYAFKGSYDANPNGSNLFCGITVDETYLLKAESSARLGNTSTALFWLNKLLVTRWKNNTFVNYTANTAQEALDLILAERRKELAFRGGIRWTDIRRLNTEPGRQITLKRVIIGTEYVLPPGDLRFAFLIPNSVIQISGIEQNER